MGFGVWEMGFIVKLNRSFGLYTLQVLFFDVLFTIFKVYRIYFALICQALLKNILKSLRLTVDGKAVSFWRACSAGIVIANLHRFKFKIAGRNSYKASVWFWRLIFEQIVDAAGRLVRVSPYPLLLPIHAQRPVLLQGRSLAAGGVVLALEIQADCHLDCCIGVLALLEGQHLQALPVGLQDVDGRVADHPPSAHAADFVDEEQALIADPLTYLCLFRSS
jgi:hypothetical protein